MLHQVNGQHMLRKLTIILNCYGKITREFQLGFQVSDHFLKIAIKMCIQCQILAWSIMWDFKFIYFTYNAVICCEGQPVFTVNPEQIVSCAYFLKATNETSRVSKTWNASI